MPTQADLAPLFTEVPMTTDDAIAIASALHDIAQSDGTHEDEIAMIGELVASLGSDFDVHGKLVPMTPEKLAHQLADPTLRTVAVQCSVLLAWADGAITPKERERVKAYAQALGVGGAEFERIERTITAWVQGGDAAPILS